MFADCNFADRNHPVIIIGAGPAGLTAALELQNRGLKSTVFEKDPVVGGLAKTVCHNGYRFDLGGHRFFSKVDAVNNTWHEILGDDFFQRPRRSRIYFDGKFFDYPIRLGNTLSGLGLKTSAVATLSFIRAKSRPRLPEMSLEDWVINRFGKVLYEAFFKTYTEKVWGIPCSQIGANWAEQRIRGISLFRAAMAAFSREHSQKVKSLIDSFHYPRLGAGQMWESVHDRVVAAGHSVLTNASVVSMRHDGSLIREVVVNKAGQTTVFPAHEVISSMPLRELIEKLDPQAPSAVMEVAQSLRYRDFMMVALIMGGANLFPDNWIYVHEPSVKVGRIQNFGNWSSDMVCDAGHSCLGLEYFCFKGDALWTMDDKDLLALAGKEISYLGLAPKATVIDGTVVRAEKAYPVYDPGYSSKTKTIRTYLDRFRNLHPVGRNGLHKYNNQDHSMFTAMLAVRNILGEKHNVWSINADCEYHEEIRKMPEVISAQGNWGSDSPVLIGRK